ncbi:MAG TPA: Na+/H+ antiporter NhaC family protein [Pseudomonadales bacterium]|nr:Na+/H+ antiporter NhaC family protein [Pseudomonadales bacterium]
MHELLGVWVVLPACVAIAVVLYTREVISALLAAMLCAEALLLMGGQQSVLGAPAAVVDRGLAVFASQGNVKVLAFSLLIGAFLALIRYSGGVAATVRRLVSMGVANSSRRAGLLSFLVGLVLFIESNLSILTAGIVSRGLFDRFGMSRARLAYIVDATAAPVCILLMMNAWGVFVFALIQNQGVAEPGEVLLGTIGYNFYAWIALGLAFYTVWTGRVFGALKRFEARPVKALHDVSQEPQDGKSRYMLLPFAALLITMLLGLYFTGDGNMRRGDGGMSILFAVLLGTGVAYGVLRFDKRFRHAQLMDLSFKGIGELLPMVMILLLSIALGSSLKALGTGIYIASVAGEHLPLWAIAPLVFLSGAVVAFTTGTSWGTFAIMIPIAVPLAVTTGLPIELLVAAALGGGVFGDHCSPISDTTVVSALAAGCDVLDHVWTQLPYALFGAALTSVAYLVVSVV